MNAYEIRVKILKMAKEQVYEDYYQKKEIFSCSTGMAEGKINSMKGHPETPTVVDILRVANTMYDFVKKQE